MTLILLGCCLGRRPCAKKSECSRRPRSCFRRRRLRTATRCFAASASTECKARTFEISAPANHHPTVGVCSTALGRYHLGLGGLDRQWLPCCMCAGTRNRSLTTATPLAHQVRTRSKHPLPLAGMSATFPGTFRHLWPLGRWQARLSWTAWAVSRKGR